MKPAQYGVHLSGLSDLTGGSKGVGRTLANVAPSRKVPPDEAEPSPRFLLYWRPKSGFMGGGAPIRPPSVKRPESPEAPASGLSCFGSADAPGRILQTTQGRPTLSGLSG